MKIAIYQQISMNNFIQLSKNFGTNSKQLGLLEQFYVGGGAGSERELVYGDSASVSGILTERLLGRLSD